MNDSNQLPTLQSELNINTKRMRTLARLEKALSKFSSELRDISETCPFDSSSITTQQIVNDASGWSISFTGHLIAVVNQVRTQHYQDIDILHAEALEEEDIAVDAEDAVALLKTHLSPELLASRETRLKDASREKEFEQQLKRIQETYLTKKPNNAQSDHYPVLDN